MTEETESPAGMDTPPETAVFPGDPNKPITIPVLPPDYVKEGVDPEKMGIIEKKY